MHWRDLWPILGTIAAVIGSLLGIYYGPKKMLETYDWYMYRFFDFKVHLHLESKKTQAQLTRFGHQPSAAMPLSVREICEATGLSERRVRASLGRLYKQRKVHPHTDDKWKV